MKDLWWYGRRLGIALMTWFFFFIAYTHTNSWANSVMSSWPCAYKIVFGILFTNFILCLRCNQKCYYGILMRYCHHTWKFDLWTMKIFALQCFISFLPHAHVKTCITEQCLHAKYINMLCILNPFFIHIGNRLFSLNHAHYWALSKSSLSITLVGNIFDENTLVFDLCSLLIYWKLEESKG